MFCSPASWLERVGVLDGRSPAAAAPRTASLLPPETTLKEEKKKKKKPQKSMLGYHGVQKLPDVRRTFPSNT